MSNNLIGPDGAKHLAKVLLNKKYITEYVWKYKMSMHSRYVMADISIEAQYQHIGQVNNVTLT